MTPGPILVINPNSSQVVTEGLRKALAGFCHPGGPEIECLTITHGPPGVVTQRDVDEAGLNTAAVIEARPDAGAYVLACYSQPGLDLARSITGRPVYGIQDAGVLSALALADLFGVIAVAQSSIPRHLRNLRRLGVDHRLAGEVALEGNVSVADSGHGEDSFALLLGAGEKLKAMGAGAIVLGCAGMSGHRKRLEEVLGVQVVDPTQAAVAMAFGKLVSEGL
ncbi:aspartate/glutamate racemase family protein [Rhizobiaceae bacterium BDR2-2]|uniref:Aspartate/glutamate racemase family protein n=1 Tax=Ectorhizobium quercum TaxID=2965071 RepID=A0AAE3SXD2_9HYPH|nr:aspartate/glutamate racemase family protein [Ectorhizobium quercum]MCX8998365.1 aspartate/glutamate racemase family protein [Ectorhizobium quercum]